jgi:hypothetical protein
MDRYFMIDLFAVVWGIFLIAVPEVKRFSQFTVPNGITIRCLGGLVVLIGLFGLTLHVPRLGGLLPVVWLTLLDRLRMVLAGAAAAIFVLLAIRVFRYPWDRRR